MSTADTNIPNLIATESDFPEFRSSQLPQHINIRRDVTKNSAKKAWAVVSPGAGTVPQNAVVTLSRPKSRILSGVTA